MPEPKTHFDLLRCELSASSIAKIAPVDPSFDRLPPNQQLVASSKWPIIGEREPAGRGSATLSIGGLVLRPMTWTLEALSQLPQTKIQLDIHCVTRWSKYDVIFEGVLLRDLLDKVGTKQDARFVSFVSNSSRNHSSSLRLDTALALSTLIATHVNGQLLELEHGGPIRNIVPNRYFYKSVKWLKQIELLENDRLGYWEAESGYHNEADPWREQRYIAPSIDRRRALELIASRDFSGLDLRSIDASSRELAGLRAVSSSLRDADFRHSDLVGADFSAANLSNAHFELSKLRGANFIGADLEGANFSGADLRGANFSQASLFGATFTSLAGQKKSSAILDSTTIFPLNCQQPLTPEQLEYVQAHVGLKRD